VGAEFKETFRQISRFEVRNGNRVPGYEPVIIKSDHYNIAKPADLLVFGAAIW
jgi:hypothetical protein